MAMCQCAACGRKFTGTTAFDKHQTAGNGSFGSVTCNDPATRGLVENVRGQWGWPESAYSRSVASKMRAEQGLPRVNG